ncbi:oxidoreductase [Alcaligenes faecalis]|uniref:PDR/VanB family oxidoreductase n=1 Tax=Alcaligenes faecalis TaxID=511 RepID=UPI00193363A6|nr:PDR/VanB family oxidoreductase [Alcaligenes faecalis]QRF90563.1 oxidoreductase [Alcaligenes faecalis]
MAFSAISVFVHTIRFECEGIISLDLRPTGECELPQFTPGAHIDLHLPGGVSRSYSLVSDPQESHHYVVSVQNARDGRGGSKFIHEYLKVGTAITISKPRNNFPLQETLGKTVLVAGGIGITPIYSMFRHLVALGRPVEMLYCAHSRREAAFLKELAPYSDQVVLNFSDEPPRISLHDYLARHDTNVNFYCCGPISMLTTFEIACAELNFPHCYVERFTVTGSQTVQERSYEVVLSKSGGSITVESGHSLLESLLMAGVECDYVCKQGICGACETVVLHGEPDHRDSVLTAGQKAEGTRMMICVSGAKSNTLVLDL